MAGKSSEFLGKGISFPVRLNRDTGGMKVTVGEYDPVSVAASFLGEKWTPRNPVEETANHIAESIYHILFTNRFEHETLPEFYSRINYALFENNSPEFKLVFTAYLKHGVSKWERRAKFPEKGGVEWFSTGVATDKGELPLVARVEFITQQTDKNLVAPFVTVRQARTQLYPSTVIDNNGHDLNSRYYGRQSYKNSDGYSYLRLQRNIDIPPAPDDSFYMVRPLDTWMLISHVELYDITHWYYIYLCYLQDKAKEAGTRDVMNPNIEPTPGDIIRIPSRSRVLLLNSRR